MKSFLLLLILSISQILSAQSQTVEIESSNSGLLLPRLVDTSSVNNPEEGLLIYDLADKKPAFYNGNEWKSALSSSNLSSIGDSLTYTVIDLSSSSARMVDPLVVGTYTLYSFSWGFSTARTITSMPPYTVSYQEFTLSMPIDANWIPFQEHLRMNVDIAQNLQIEINIFESGNAIPAFSFKLGGGIIVGSVSTGVNNAVVTLSPRTIGYKHNASGLSRAFNVSTGDSVPY